MLLMLFDQSGSKIFLVCGAHGISGATIKKISKHLNSVNATIDNFYCLVNLVYEF